MSGSWNGFWIYVAASVESVKRAVVTVDAGGLCARRAEEEQGQSKEARHVELDARARVSVLFFFWRKNRGTDFRNFNILRRFQILHRAQCSGF